MDRIERDSIVAASPLPVPFSGHLGGESAAETRLNRDASQLAALTIALPRQLIHGNCAAFKRGTLDRLDEGAQAIVLDCAGCEYIDSMGLGVLVSISKRIAAAGGTLTLAGLTGDLRTLFELTKLDTLFTIRDTAAEVAS